MGTKVEDKEELEIVIITEEQVDALPEKAVETVRSLKGTLPHAQLQIFIPVVQKYIELRDMASKVKLEKDEDGNITDESITYYKSVKKAVGAFNGELKRKMKDVKDPINAIKDDILTVENTFKDESDKIKEATLKEFEPYEAEVARKKKEAQDKKDAALNAAVTKANEEAETLRKQSMKTEVINALKYKEVMENITQNANDAVNSMNERSLTQHQSVLTNTKFEDIKSKYDTSMIEEETLAAIEKSFDTAKSNADKLIADALARMAEDRRREIENSIRSAPAVPPVPPAPVQPVSTDRIPGSVPTAINFQLYPTATPYVFANNIKSIVKNLEEALQDKMKENVTPELAELQMKFNQFNS